MAAVTIAVNLEPKKIKPVTVSTVSPSICHEAMGPDAKPPGCSLIKSKPFKEQPLIILKDASIDDLTSNSHFRFLESN